MLKNKYLLLCFLFLIYSCSNDKRKPSVVYMPDMYYSKAYDPYDKATKFYPYDLEKSSVPIFNNNSKMTALEPVEGTIPLNDKNYIPLDLKPDEESYNNSKKIYNIPVQIKSNLHLGEKLYIQNCAVCHGENGDGKGVLIKNKVYSGVPDYVDRDITIGSVYYVIMYGKNTMGSYASNLDYKDRWIVADYVINLRNKRLK